MKKCIICLVGMLLMIFGVSVSAQAIPINLALSGSATQSSTGYSGYANFAIDDNTSGVYGYGAGSVTHTNFEQGAWWQVDLGDVFALDNIVLWNRTDCCMDRLSNFRVSVLDTGMTELWGQDYFTGGGYPNPTLDILLPNNTSGQFAMVQLLGSNYLSLAEVQVFGESAPIPEPSTMLLLGSGLFGVIALRKKIKKS